MFVMNGDLDQWQGRRYDYDSLPEAKAAETGAEVIVLVAVSESTFTRPGRAHFALYHYITRLDRQQKMESGLAIITWHSEGEK